MPNFCAIDFKIAGREEAVQEFVQMLSRNGPYKEGGLVGLGRVFSFDLDETLTVRDPADPSRICVQGSGDCANSIREAIVDWSPFNLESECKRLGVVVEGFSSEPSNMFQEHYLCNKGHLELASCVKYEEHVVENMSPEEIKNLASEKNMTIEELMSKVNCNGEYTEGGFPDYCDFLDLFHYFEAEKTIKFILDNELIIGNDARCKTVNGYLWATDALVAQLKAQEGKILTAEQLESMDNINFYVDYDAQQNTVSLIGSYYLVHETGEDYHTFSLPLREGEAPVLIQTIEAYCQTELGCGCLEAVDRYRAEEGLMRISDLNALLEKLASAEAITYKGIRFDDWTLDEETGGIYGEMCQGCADKYMDLIKEELDDGSAIGSCSVKGCSVIGMENGDAKHYYIDFKPEYIKVIERKPSLDALCAEAEVKHAKQSIAEAGFDKAPKTEGYNR